MKKLLAIILTVVMCISFCACGNSKENSTEKAMEKIDANKLSTGETVCTDIIELTVNKAELAFYAKSASTMSSDGTTTNVDEACSPLDSEKGAFYKTNKGRTLLCLDFTLKNLDRDTLDIGGSFSSVEVSFAVNQNENNASMKGYSLNDPDGDTFASLGLEGSPISTNGGEFKTSRTSNELVDAGDTVRIKTVGVLGFEAEDLNAPFDLIVKIGNSSGEAEQFVYAVM